ncbi:hypothetical protein DYH09_31125 [bacterium CPR1]|nr:hypothetical protein [bacterium CPR1]
MPLSVGPVVVAALILAVLGSVAATGRRLTEGRRCPGAWVGVAVSLAAGPAATLLASDPLGAQATVCSLGFFVAGLNLLLAGYLLKANWLNFVAVLCLGLGYLFWMPDTFKEIMRENYKNL